MAPATDSPRSERRGSGEWTPRISVTRRILAVNIFALAILAAGFFYLDSYRTRLIDARLTATNLATSLIVSALDQAPDNEGRRALLARAAQDTGLRLRIYGADNAKRFDSFALARPTYALANPVNDPVHLRLARLLDRFVETIALAHTPPSIGLPEPDHWAQWPELAQARADKVAIAMNRFAPNRTPYLSVARPMADGRSVLLATVNARDITETVRAERLRIGLVLAAAIIASVLLSLFLARTIVLPLRRLARAAVRVRLGRAREVIVPRLPDRRDEIGMLARAISDMSQALRQRIDATETFAADVSHELKNPIASLRSALEGLSRIEEPALRRKLLDIAQDDVRRLDRLVTDIAEASRIDAQLSRAQFERIDLATLIGRVVRAQSSRDNGRAVRISFARPPRATAMVTGDPGKLSRVFENLIDNARSFSPDGGKVRLSATVEGERVIVAVEDDGPGVPEEARDTIFRRFHSVRPERDGFGKHSGLGLAIARTILEGHNGTIRVEDRSGGTRGARFVVTLPLAERHEADEPGEAE